ncbi:hypothetical protein J6O48_01990 [bacterium]|nr:hypothetical protein [bacterium]
MLISSPMSNQYNFTGKKVKSNKLADHTSTGLKTQLGEENLSIIEKIYKLGKQEGVETYIFGGGVRDILIGKKPHDIDVIVTGDAITFTQALKENYKDVFHSVKLKHKVKRAVAYSKTTDVDIVPLHPNGDRITDKNQLRRALYTKSSQSDYKMNSMFIKVGENENGSLKLKLIDIFGAKKDLKKNKLSVTKSLDKQKNPVQGMRGLRFLQRYDMKLEPNAKDWIKECIQQPHPKDISYRLRLIKEMYKYLTQDKNIFKTIKNIIDFKLLKMFI